MKVLIYNRKGFVKYIPLTKPSYGYDFDIDEKIMPPKLLKKLKSFLRKRDKKMEIDYSLPVGLTKEGAKRGGCEIVVMNRAQYESKKDEIVL
jgi:hypothetical protein